MAMEDLSSVFCYQESVEELKQKLLCMTYELQSARMQADEEVRKNKETMESMKQLLHLLQVAYKERDEAKNQLQKLLLNPAEALPILSPETTLLNSTTKPGRTSSGITESNSISDTTTYTNPHNSSPGDSLYDVVSPIAVAPFLQDFSSQVYRTTATPPSAAAQTVKITDRESAIIYNLARGRPLPQKGKLLQAVMETGPLLQTLMVAGPLPRWRNPPPLQPLQSHAVATGGFDGEKQGRIGTEAGTHLLKRPLNNLSSGYAKMTCGSSQVLTNSALNFAGGGGGICLNNAMGFVSPAGFGLGSQIIPTPKRQRIQ